MKTNIKVLLALGNGQSADFLEASLLSAGYEVVGELNGDASAERVHQLSPDLLITSSRLSNMEGMELCRQVRSRSSMAIIALAAAEGPRRSALLDAGADYCVSEPVDMEELLASVRAALRRSAPNGSGGETMLEAGDFRVVLDSRRILVRGSEIRLTPKEYALLISLVRSQGAVLTHQMLVRAIWGDGSLRQAEHLRDLVARLRRKVEADPANPGYILTEHCIGYKFRPLAA